MPHGNLCDVTFYDHYFFGRVNLLKDSFIVVPIVSSFELASSHIFISVLTHVVELCKQYQFLAISQFKKYCGNLTVRIHHFIVTNTEHTIPQL